MNNQSASSQDCGCSDGCCTPQKKSNTWRKWIFVAIILAAGAIITVKLVTKQEKKCCDKPETCCSQSNAEE